MKRRPPAQLEPSKEDVIRVQMLRVERELGRLMADLDQSAKDVVNSTIGCDFYVDLESAYLKLKDKNRQSSQPTLEQKTSDETEHIEIANNVSCKYPPPLPIIRQKKLEEQVFTHKSRANELFPHCLDARKLLSKHNERLEFLGDDVLEGIVTKIIYERFPNANEGELSKLRATLVGNDMVSKFATLYGLHEKLQLGLCGEKSQLRKCTKVVADVFEAYLGALYLDNQIDAAFEWVKQLIEPELVRFKMEPPINKLAKAELQRRIGKAGGKVEYRCIEKKMGQREEYKVACIINGSEVSWGVGSNIKLAGTRAAMKALSSWEEDSH
ncbi:double-strand-specific pac1 ribonuclease [Schizosaccharomyces japonicus yFS275]|uniref:ribonuclease III n=1 Tax=Schizosaccharomyces japonicus (strain yFS275 / FY16936) TaxID=402676 RepID=B6K1P5_SCHJY|nr:double-strand-specific pac1 ribonuclease [Schizosaccharomyces japonicus yFS275]EEB07076.1 double-strand-specific pac1 ribonuclease [Schizosaccharomyces japonicus yFS275]